MIAHAQAIELNLLNLLSGSLIRHEGVNSVAMLVRLTEDDSTVIVTTVVAIVTQKKSPAMKIRKYDCKAPPHFRSGGITCPKNNGSSEGKEQKLTCQAYPTKKAATKTDGGVTGSRAAIGHASCEFNTNVYYSLTLYKAHLKM